MQIQWVPARGRAAEWGSGLLLAFALCSASWASGDQVEKFAVYYSNEVSLATLLPFDLLVFDSIAHPDVQSLSDRKKQVLGYVSLGEVASHRPYFAVVQQQGLLVQENPNWPGSWLVDVRDRLWVKLVVEELLPEILHQGFDGIFIDTLDNPAHLERVNPQTYNGMTRAAALLVKTIRYHFPTITIMLNRGYEILPDVAGDVDMSLGESVYTDYDFETKRYRVVETALYTEQIAILQAARQRNPDLQIMTLDYWDPEDPEGIAAIYAEQRKNGFVPYVATIDLDRIVPEPRP